jgi:hypothetical protein
MPSIEIKILLLIACGAFVYVVISDIRRGCRAIRLIAWVKENHPEEWNALPWTARRISRIGGLRLLFKRRMISDRHFTAKYKTIKPFQKDQIIAYAVAFGAFALVGLGVKSGYWHW